MTEVQIIPKIIETQEEYEQFLAITAGTSQVLRDVRLSLEQEK